MKLKLRNLNTIHAGLMWLFQQQLDAKLQYYVARNVAKIEEELKRIGEVKQKILDEYDAVLPEPDEDEGEDDEGEDENKGNQPEEYEFPTEEAEEKAQGEFDELLDEAVEVDIVPLKLGWLDDIKFAGPQMYGLWRIIADSQTLTETKEQNEVDSE